MGDPVALAADVMQVGNDAEFATSLVVDAVVSFVGTLLVTGVIGALVVAVSPNWTHHVAQGSRNRWVERTLVGTLGFLGIAVLAGLLVVTIVGAIVGIPVLIALFFIALIGQPIGAIATTGLVFDRTDADDQWLNLGIGVVVLATLNAVPFIGGILGAIYTGCAIGELIVRTWNELR